MSSTGLPGEGAKRMFVDATSLAHELRRRRVGRPALRHALVGSQRVTWLPGELHDVPTALLVLAAFSMERPVEPEQV